MTELPICCICLESLEPRDGRARLSCGQCNNQIHLVCQKKEEKCPVCRQLLDKESDPNIYTIKLSDDYYCNTIKLEENTDLSLLTIIQKIAKILDDNNNNNLFSNDLAQLHMYINDIKEYNYNCIISKSENLKIKIVNGWNVNIAELKKNNYNLLTQFFESITINNNILLDHSLTLQLVIKLVKPVMTRGGSIIDKDIEEEILEVLVDAHKNQSSLCQALRYEFF
jgi:hypothetical protein